MFEKELMLEYHGMCLARNILVHDNTQHEQYNTANIPQWDKDEEEEFYLLVSSFVNGQLS